MLKRRLSGPFVAKSGHWRGPRKGLMTIGAGIVRYGRHLVFHLAEVALRRIHHLRHGDGKRDEAHAGIVGSFKSRFLT